MDQISNYSKKTSALIRTAESKLGVREVGGNNKGPDVERFQKAIDGKAEGEPWCCCFAQFCVREADHSFTTETPSIPHTTTWLYPTEHCLTLFLKTPKEARLAAPEKGCLVVWGWFKDGKATGSGHIGIVTDVVQDAIHTIEGNTGSGEGMNREGDGVYRRVRSLKVDPKADFRILGFISAWPKQSSAGLVA